MMNFRQSGAWRLGILSGLLGLVATSCIGDELSLDAKNRGFEHIARRLGVTIRPGPGGFEGNPDCTVEDCQPDAFAAGVLNGCTRALENRNPCQLVVDGSDRYLCASNLLLEVIDSPAPREIRLHNSGDPGTVLVPPQDDETNSELARLAHQYAHTALQLSLDAFDPARVPGCDLAVLGADGPIATLPGGDTVTLTWGEALGYTFREAYEISQEAEIRMSESASAVSDVAYSRQTDTADASRDAMAPFASRTTAAHMLVGGELGLPAIAGVATEGFFSRSSLSGEGQRAVEYFRAAALDPNVVGDDTDTGPTIDDIVFGSGPVAAEGSIRYRLGLMQSRSSLTSAASPDVVYEVLGVTRAGFIEARELLREEIRAFDRVGAAVLPPEPLPDGTTTADQGIVLYAASRVAPQQLLPSYWSAILRFDPTPEPMLTTPGFPVWEVIPSTMGDVPPGDTWGEETPVAGRWLVSGRRSVASVVDEAHRRGADVLALLCPAGVCPPSVEATARIFAGVIGDLGANPVLGGGASPRPSYEDAPYLGRARACWFDAGSSGFAAPIIVLQLAAPALTDQLLVVRGREGLECAVRGTLEGVPCSEDVWNAAQFDSLFPWYSPAPDVFLAIVGGQPTGDRPTAGTLPLFVVRRRDGVDPDNGAQPGQYEELTGFVLPEPSTPGAGTRYCVGVPIVPRADREAAALIEPSTSAPYRPAESCAGLPSDMRIPLENELTSDGDGVESSWRHYLSLARQSAAEADALGEDVIRSGLEMDARAEAATDELSRLCGVSINLTSIASTLESDSVPRVAASGPPCSLPYTQQDDICVLDPVLYAASQSLRDEDLAKLAACLGTDVVPWATLGDTALCIWDATPGARGGICEGADPEHGMPCPGLADINGSCMAFNAPADADVIEVRDRLGLFQQPAEPVPPPPNPLDLPCDALARLRNGDNVADLEDQLTGLLQYDTLAQHARQLSWEALVGDYSTVRYAGSVVFRTGSVTSPTVSQWPMGPAPIGACPATITLHDPTGYTGPLFCLAGLDTSSAGRLQRARMNDLLARAVMAARIFTGAGLQDLVFPYYSTNQAAVYEVIPDSFAYDALAGTSPRALCAWSGQFLIDHSTTDLADPYTRDVADLGTRACVIEGGGSGSAGMGCGTTIPNGAEWARCPYDGGACDVFDDETDCDDGVRDDRNIPLILRAVDEGLNVASASRAATQGWESSLPNFVRSAHVRSAEELRYRAVFRDLDVDDVTRYFDVSDSTVPVGSCLGEYETCVEGIPEARLMRSGNMAYIADNGLSFNDLLNGLELTCQAARNGLPPEDINCVEPKPINDLTDAYRMAGYLECRANTISGRGANSLIANLPAKVIEVLRNDGPGVYGTGSGELDAEISEIRSALVELGNHRLGIASDMRSYASRVRSLQTAVSRSDRSREIEELMLVGRAADRITACATALFDAAASAASEQATGSGYKFAGAATTCANSALQVGLDTHITSLREANIEDDLIAEFARFDGESGEFGRRMSERAIAMSASLERLDAALSRLRANQSQARRALSRALLLDDDGMGAHMAVNTVYRSRYNTQLQRYRRAHQRAVRAAFIARIALEQRLGMPLADIEDDVFSDEAPREWVDTICTLPSIDYDAIRMATPGSTGERDSDTVDFPGPADYSGAYVGDYVRRLEDVFESYSFVYPFRDGTDTAVVSLRDDIFVTRAPCDVAPTNLLYNGGRLDVMEGLDRVGWRTRGCDPSAVTGTGIVSRQCVSINRLDQDPSDMPDGDPNISRIGRPVPYRVHFGDTAATTGESRFEQELALPPGRYRVSWYARPGPSSGDPDPRLAVEVRDSSDALLLLNERFHEATAGSINGWERNWFFFDAPVDDAYRVVIPVGATPIGPRDLDIAGLMLEDVTNSVVGSVSRMIDVGVGDGAPSSVKLGQRAVPAPFSEAGDTGVTSLRACTDVAGQYFRREAWEYDCVRVCTDGYDGNCPPEVQESRCFWQTSFDISSDSLQQVLVDGDAGFAAGNFNYRIESIGVNFVGTGLRDCEASGGSAGCYASGNLSFSMLHQGPFLVRNALGRLYDAPVFPGRIESARALAAERYLTNPLSSADRNLIDPFVRTEFQGRPMGGAIILRIWDDPRFVFDRLEDVQLLLNYRYWQHQR